ncbi:response regulatory protein ypdB [Klebsiella pneumoniae]|uniref:Response regulatory protein ypdB n=1 Tax=Klebsiella pneumoniae TaxID=573 RepID=A0A377VB65_KLEPN|nr:response regulatory protein ypdB [Klebsiella pneumoniae]
MLRLRDLEFQVPVSRSKVKEFRQLDESVESGKHRHPGYDGSPGEEYLKHLAQRLTQMRAGAQQAWVIMQRSGKPGYPEHKL